MNYADEDEITERYVEGCEAQDGEQLRQSYLTAAAVEHLTKAAHFAELAAESLSPMTAQAERRSRVLDLVLALRDQRDGLERL